MKYIRSKQNNVIQFKLMQHPQEMFVGVTVEKPDEIDPQFWNVIDSDMNLYLLLERHRQLSFTKTELLTARLLALSEFWIPPHQKDYCLEQANLINKNADEAIERIATNLIDPCEFVDVHLYGLPTWIRRLTLAFVQEIGVKI
jgi:hypothetical protein